MQAQQQMQSMYMASAMYPYYTSQQGMGIPSGTMQSAGVFPGYMFGFPGYPPVNTVLPMYPSQLPSLDPSLRAGFPQGMPSYMPGMMPFPSPEYAGYYQKLMAGGHAAQHPNDGGYPAVADSAAPTVTSSSDDSPEKLEQETRGSDLRSSDSLDRRTTSASLQRNESFGRSQGNETFGRSLSDRERKPTVRAPEIKRSSSDRSRDGVPRLRRDQSLGLSSAPTRKNSLLEAFKSNKARKFEFKEILGHIFEFSMDQHGSRFIQQKLDTLTAEEREAAVTEVLPKCMVLMQDVFGNYVVQKLLEHGTRAQRSKIVRTTVGQVLPLSLQMYGCRVVQKALEVCTLDEGIAIARELDGHIMKCVKDQNGNHVVQKAIECVPTPHVIHIIDNFLGSVVPLCMHPFGCRVIQRILEHCTDIPKRQIFMDDILKATIQLAQDQYGNYVVQHVLERGTAAEKHEVVSKLARQIVPLSQHKFASNVVEKCLVHGGAAERQLLLAEMLGGAPQEAGEEDPLQAMMKDQFANYVVQKLLEVCDEEQRETLLTRMRLHLNSLRKFTYAKHIVARVEKLLVTGDRMQNSARRGKGDAPVELGPDTPRASDFSNEYASYPAASRLSAGRSLESSQY